MHLVDLIQARSADLEDDVGLLPDRGGTVDQSSTGLVIGLVREVSFGPRAPLNKYLGEAFLEQEDNILRSNRDASLVRKGLPGDTDGQIGIWSGLGDNGGGILCARGCGRRRRDVGQDGSMANELKWLLRPGS